MSDVLNTYLKRLTNLSGNNRSLLLLRLIKDHFIDIHSFDFVNGAPSFHIIEQLIQGVPSINLCQVLDTHDKDSNARSVELRKLARMDHLIFEERGARDLYVGWPFVRGKLNDETPVRCPLVFFPVALEQSGNNWQLKLRQGVNITLNKSFLLAYAYYNNLPPDDNLIDFVISNLDSDSTVFRTELYELLKESTIELNFNQANFMDQLEHFKSMTRADLEKTERQGILKLFPEAVLGVFPQSGSYLVPDYLTLLKETDGNIESYFTKKIKDDPEDEAASRFSDKALEENTFTPFDMDIHQEYALDRVKKGNSINVQGPPGSGKSQLIANMICDYMARGKNVLLISQKRAALDVVFERLKDIDIHDFVGLVHDFKNDRKDIFEKIDRQIGRLGEYEAKNGGLDTVYLERAFQQASRQIEQLTGELQEYKEALFSENDCGKSIKELYLISDRAAPGINLKQSYSFIDFHKAVELEKKLNLYFQYVEKFVSVHPFWVDHRVSFAKFEASDRERIKAVIVGSPQDVQELNEKANHLITKKLDFAQWLFFVEKQTELNQFVTSLNNDQAYAFYYHFLKNVPDENESWIAELERTIMQCFKGAGMEQSLPSASLGRFQVALMHAIQARRSIFGVIRWRLFSKDRTLIKRALVANGLRNTGDDFQVLLTRIDNRLNYEHNVRRVEEKKWLFGFPGSYRKIEIQNWFFYLRVAMRSLGISFQLHNLNEVLSFQSENRKRQIDLLKGFQGFVAQFEENLTRWKLLLSKQQLEILHNRPDIEQDIVKALDEAFENLVDFDKLRDEMLKMELDIAKALEDVPGDAETRIAVFKNSLALAWIDHLETKYPILRMVSTVRFEQMVKELNEAVEKKREVGVDILLQKSREKTYEDLEYNRLQNRISYRDLQHQVTKKRQIWPLRKVIAEFYEEVFKLIPCWMVSPESASAIFPMKQYFDLVVFDEASQCFAERAIPAMYRGRQLVIAGDKMQLRPFDLYRAQWDEDEENADLEMDSLLDLSSRYLPEISLSGHYRSKNLELISFSNERFYGNRLKMLPDRHWINHDHKPLQFHLVDGTWESNTNEAEADFVLNLLKKCANKDVGIVTFNAKQQNLLFDMIDEQLPDWRETFPKLFIKNIENVQGDERDIIIFSTVYAPDKHGKLQLRFGSLNQPGGENRLNVAVTRAREQVHLVTSIDPAKLDVSKVKNRGPVVLKEYLEYAKRLSGGKRLGPPVPESGHAPEWYLKNKVQQELMSLNPELQAVPNLPYGDLTIMHALQYLGIVLTDDSNYYGSINPKSPFVYDPELLTDRNWPQIRFFSREWWSDREMLTNRLRVFAHRIIP